MADSGEARRLFQPLKIANGKITLKHRVVYAPMTRMRGLPLPNPPGDDGFTRNWCPDDLAVEYYGQRATDGGLLISEGIAVSQQGVAYPGVPGMYLPQQHAAWKKVTQAVHEKGAYIYAQLWHAGRVAVPPYTGLQSVSSSSNPVGAGSTSRPAPSHPAPDPRDGSVILMKDHPPQKLDAQGVDHVISQFVDCAKSAVACGFDGIEVHGANGYLGDQFLASNVNTRDDEFGGSPEKRTKFLLKLLAALSAAIGSENVGIRLAPYGLHHHIRARARIETWSALCRGIKSRTDIGPISYVHFVKPRADQLHMLEDKIDYLTAFDHHNSLSPFRSILADTPLIAASGYTPENCFEEVDSGKIDAVAFGRLFLANPDFVERLRTGKRMNMYNRLTFYGPFSSQPRPVGYIDYPAWEEAAASKKTKWYGDRPAAYFNFKNLGKL